MPVKVTITRGATINLGNYESARIDLSIDLGDTTAEKWDEADARLCAWLEQEVEKIQNEAGLPPRPASRFTGRA